MKERVNYNRLIVFFHHSKVSLFNFAQIDGLNQGKSISNSKDSTFGHPILNTPQGHAKHMQTCSLTCCLGIVGLRDCGIAKDPALTKHNGGKPYDALAPPGSYSKIPHCDKEGVDTKR